MNRHCLPDGRSLRRHGRSQHLALRMEAIRTNVRCPPEVLHRRHVLRHAYRILDLGDYLVAPAGYRCGPGRCNHSHLTEIHKFLLCRDPSGFPAIPDILLYNKTVPPSFFLFFTSQLSVFSESAWNLFIRKKICPQKDLRNRCRKRLRGIMEFTSLHFSQNQVSGCLRRKKTAGYGVVWFISSDLNWN